ncbi:MAG: autotransporter-associated beta strand repeat-containing protein, partial [Kiritimatiellaeota bacterium]|nr:autotransporter-associated beta strand repeat-containing protein [Kiritimatiellota bacterium]
MTSGAISNGTLVGASYTFSDGTAAANLAGIGALTNNGGTTILSGTNTYSGGTTLSAGTLTISSYTNLPATGTLTFNGGFLGITGTTITNLDTITFNNSSFNGGFNVAAGSTVTVNNVLSGNGALAKLGVGTLALQGSNTFGGGVTLNAGTLRIENASALGTNTFTINAGTINNQT